MPVADLIQGRSPSLDLDSLYGLGPGLTPEFYAADKIHLKTGTTVKSDFPADGIADKPHPGFDLPAPLEPQGADPRHPQRREPGVGQTHNAFIRFHNRVVDTLAADGVPQAGLFAAAREMVVRHYQWMIRTDFLPRIVKPPARERTCSPTAARSSRPPRPRATSPRCRSSSRWPPTGSATAWCAAPTTGTTSSTTAAAASTSCSTSRARAARSAATPGCRATGSPTSGASTTSARPGATTCARSSAAATS